MCECLSFILECLSFNLKATLFYGIITHSLLFIGMSEAFCRNEEPPCIDLADAQMDNSSWNTYVMLRSSDWIDCDSPESWLADISCEELEKVRSMFHLNRHNVIPTSLITAKF